jgi:ABC-type glycerol-3-phosphate transport system substrate-binding protein
MNRHVSFPFAGALAAALVLLACSGSPLPGTVLGTYKVVGQIQTNSCGLGAPNPWTFDIQLSQDGATLYWSWMDGTPPLSSPLTTESNATLTSTLQVNVDGTADGGLGPCTMDRADNFQVALGSGSPPANFTGTIAYAFSSPSGSDCADQLTTAGGEYDALPCAMVYSVAASRQ